MKIDESGGRSLQESVAAIHRVPASAKGCDVVVFLNGVAFGD